MHFRIETHDGFAAVTPGDNRMHELPDNGTRPHDCDLHGDVVEAGGFETTQTRHLCAAFDLEDADGIGLLHHAIRFGIVGRQVVE